MSGPNNERRGDISAETMEELVKGMREKVTTTERDIIWRDMTRMTLHQKDFAEKTLRFTADQKRVILNCDRFNFSTIPFGFRFIQE